MNPIHCLQWCGHNNCDTVLRAEAFEFDHPVVGEIPDEMVYKVDILGLGPLHVARLRAMYIVIWLSMWVN